MSGRDPLRANSERRLARLQRGDERAWTGGPSPTLRRRSRRLTRGHVCQHGGDWALDDREHRSRAPAEPQSGWRAGTPCARSSVRGGQVATGSPEKEARACPLGTATSHLRATAVATPVRSEVARGPRTLGGLARRLRRREDGRAARPASGGAAGRRAGGGATTAAPPATTEAATTTAPVEGQPVRGGTLLYGVRSPPSGFDPAKWWNGLSWDGTLVVFNRLLTLKDDGSLEPELLAAPPEVNADGTLYTFSSQAGRPVPPRSRADSRRRRSTPSSAWSAPRPRARAGASTPA